MGIENQNINFMQMTQQEADTFLTTHVVRFTDRDSYDEIYKDADGYQWATGLIAEADYVPATKNTFTSLLGLILEFLLSTRTRKEIQFIEK